MRRRMRGAGSARAPIQMGMGRCTGKGLSPTPCTVSQRPLKPTASCVHSACSKPICSSTRVPRVLNAMPRAAYSSRLPPTPMPSLIRPPARMSSSAACFAKRTVWRDGATITDGTNSMRWVTAAT